MPTPLVLYIPHVLGKAEARRRLEAGLALAPESGLGSGLLSLKQQWQGEQLHFELSGLLQRVTGRLEVHERSVRIELDLPGALSALAGKLSSGIRAATQKLLELRR